MEQKETLNSLNFIPREAEFGNKLVDRAKEARERLLTQTLWDAHPACLYHSAVQEITALLEDGITRALKYPNGGVAQVRILSIRLFIKDSERGDGTTKEFEYGFSKPVQTQGQTTPIQIELKDSTDKNQWKMSVEFVIPNDSKLDEEFDRAIKRVATGFLNDLIDGVGRALKQYEEESFFGRELNEVVKDAATNAKKAYAAQAAQEKVLVQVMLYHPGKWGPDETDVGFLFYPAYEVPQLAELKHTVERPQSATLWLELMKEWSRDENNEPDTSKKFDGHSAEERLECVVKTLKDKVTKASALEIILTHPVNFLVDDLLVRPENGKAPCCRPPVCFQPKGTGIAGLVAQHYVSILVPDIRNEAELDFRNRAKCLPYTIMGMIEKRCNVSPGCSAVVTPLLGKGQLLGVLFASKENKNSDGFTSRDVEIFESIAGKVGRVIQETKDYMFFRKLVSTWNSSKKKEDDYKKFVEHFTLFLPFIMNALDSTAYEGEPKGVPTTLPLQFKNKWTPKGNKWDPSGHSVEIKQAGRESSWQLVHFVKWGLDGTAFTAVLYIPCLRGDQEVALTSYYAIEMVVEEPEQIFVAHKGELEVFFNYCFAITGAVSQVGREQRPGGGPSPGVPDD